MNTRRQFLIQAPLGLLGAAVACSGNAPQSQTPATPTAGAPPTFGTAPEVGPEVTTATFAEAEKLARVTMTPSERTMAAATWRKTIAPMMERRTGPRTVALEPEVSPATRWTPIESQGHTPPTRDHFVRATVDPGPLPANDADIAFAPVWKLSRWIEKRALTSERLTNIYLDRIARLDSKVHCIITLTRDHALEQAKRADAEISAGKYRGPLHGVPWGVKDLVDTAGIATTYGAEPFRNRVPAADAPLVKRLNDAGAVLIAKLSLGALALNDIWFGGQTMNPWLLEEGASGSSAGPGAATAAGLVGFSIGSETGGSIVSPSMRCGVTGLRPTFGRVPRTGAMALSWTTDKLGPICRSAEDAALVFAAIQGPDGYDYSVKEYPFNWNASLKPSQLRIGYFKTSNQRNLFERRDAEGNTVPNAEALNFIKVLESLGAKIVEVEDPTPGNGHIDDLILHAEAGAAFQQPTLVSQLDVMMRGKTEFPSTWPDYFRAAQFYPAADYVNANRARTLLCQKWWDLFEKYDVIFTPAENTSVTNVVGTPSIVVPTGFAIPQPFQGRGGPGGPGGPGGGGGAGGGAGRAAGGGRADTTRAPAPAAPPAPVLPLPTSMYVMGPIFQDEKNLLVAHAFQQATDWHLRAPAEAARS